MWLIDYSEWKPERGHLMPQNRPELEWTIFTMEDRRGGDDLDLDEGETRSVIRSGKSSNLVDGARGGREPRYEVRDGRYGVLLFSKAFDNVSHCNLATANFEACLGAGRLSITPYLPADRVIGNLKQDQAPGVGRELSRI